MLEKVLKRGCQVIKSDVFEKPEATRDFKNTLKSFTEIMFFNNLLQYKKSLKRQIQAQISMFFKKNFKLLKSIY